MAEELDGGVDLETGSKKGLIIKASLGVGILLAAAASYYFFFMGNDEANEAESTGEAEVAKIDETQETVNAVGGEVQEFSFYPLVEPFIIMLQSDDAKKHYMQIKATIMYIENPGKTPEEPGFDQVLKNLEPVIKNDFVDFMTELSFPDIKDIKNKKKLKKDLLKIVKKIAIKKETKASIVRVLFTDYVVE